MKFLFSFLGLLFFISAPAQKIAIQQHGYPQIFYIGIKNYLTITAEGCRCKDLLIIPSAGKISGSNCSFSYSSDTAIDYLNKKESAELRIYKKGKKTNTFLGSIIYELKLVPDPVAIAGIFNDGDTVTSSRSIWSSNFTVLRSELKNFPLDISFSVKDFKVSIFRSDSIIVQNLKNIGNWYSKELKEELKNIQDGDRINFHEINVIGKDGTQRQIKPIEIIFSTKIAGRS